MIHVPPSAAEGAAIATRKYRVCSAHKWSKETSANMFELRCATLQSGVLQQIQWRKLAKHKQKFCVIADTYSNVSIKTTVLILLLLLPAFLTHFL
jgi:hypothetical protein